MLKLEPLKNKEKREFLEDPYLQDIVERNLEVAAQACIDLANRIISMEQLEKPRDYYEAILRLGEARILPLEFSQRLAPLAGFRNILRSGVKESTAHLRMIIAAQARPHPVQHGGVPQRRADSAVGARAAAVSSATKGAVEERRPAREQ